MPPASPAAAPIVIAAPGDLDARRIREIAAGRLTELAPALLADVDRQCHAAREVLAGGTPVYGVNTGMGALSGVSLTEPEQLAHQRNLLLARAAGGPPWLDAADVRAIIAVRLRTFLSGDSGVSASLCQQLVALLESGVSPAVPRTGVGSAGEIIPLAHAFGPLVGIGHVLGRAGRAVPAAETLRDRGLGRYRLGPREGHALLAGVPGATALCLMRLGEAGTLEAAMESAAALSVAAVRASRDPYAAACARGDSLQAEVLERLRAAVGELPEPRALQAPVSFRVAGPVLAHVLRAGQALAAAADRALAGVTDSPAFLGGRFTGTAGFHGIDLAAHCDLLTAALAHAAEVSAARLHRLLDTRVTGLPAQLAAHPGPDAGLVAVHKRAVGEAHALRRLAISSPVGLAETSGGQEDVQSFAWEAAEALRGALRHARAVTACELLAGYRACSLSRQAAPQGCHRVLARLAEIVGPVGADQPFGEDIERILGVLRTSGLSLAPGANQPSAPA
ncbi:MAG TPA: aromatic amino acid lyase [Streptosporangiaceae bacterium]|nr:aromatic amino acid lyase [Streptosporangiaceae bacterium]